MSIEEPKNKVAIRVLLVVMPIIVLVTAYFLLFHEKTPEQTQQQAAGTVKLDFVEPEAEKEGDLNKMEVYQQQQRNKQSEEQIRAQSNVDELFNEASGTTPTKPASKNVLENWETGSTKIEEKPVVVKKKTGSGTSTSTKAKPVTSQKQQQAQVNSETARRTGFYSSTATSKTGEANTSSGSTGTGSQTQVKGGETTEEIPCLVNTEAVIKTGQTLRLRSTIDFYVNGILIPKNTVISGLANVQNERVDVTVTAIKLPDQTVKCRYKVYDYDGVSGIYIPGGVNQQIAKNGVGSGVQMSTRIPIIGGTVSGGTQQKVQDPTVTIPVGYKVYILFQPTGY